MTLTGSRLGGEFQVNTYTTYSQRFADVSFDASGNFVVVWETYTFLPFVQSDVFGQRYDRSGNPLGTEFQVNTVTLDRQEQSSVASDASGNLVVSWQSFFQDKSSWGIFGQRFGPPPTSLSISDVSVNEGDLGSSTGVARATFTITLSVATEEPVTVDYATADGTATAPSDYLARSGTLTFQPGETSKTVTLNVKGDTEVEADETFFLNLSNPMNATLADGQGLGTILNDDP